MWKGRVPVKEKRKKKNRSKRGWGQVWRGRTNKGDTKEQWRGPDTESFWVIKRWQRYKKRLGLRESESTGERAGLAGSCTEDRERPLWTLTVIKGLCEYFDTFTRTARASSLQIYLSRSPQSLEQPFTASSLKTRENNHCLHHSASYHSSLQQHATICQRSAE